MDDNTSLAVAEQPRPTALADFRAAALAVPVERMKEGLQEYQDRRRTFRQWLLSQLIEGTHYGYPPGLEPKTKVVNGVTHYGVWSRGKDGAAGEMKWYPPSQWQAKPSFYKAGADFVCDLMNVVDTYQADMDSWKQLGEPRGTFVMACRLYPKGAEQIPQTLVGEGRGVRKTGTKGGDENNAIKMAKKCAKVDAVLNAYGLADLFVQDLEEPNQLKELHENPEQAASAPKAGTRKERTSKERGDNAPITQDELTDFLEAWKQEHADGDKAKFVGWCHAATLEEFGAGSLSKWTWGRLKRCKQAFDKEQGLVGGVPTGDIPF